MTSKNDTQHNPDVTNPLYLHPSDGPHTSTIAQKLYGSANYRIWKRDMEIVLASKHKLGFVTGLVQRDPSNPEKQDLWDTCNTMVIAWLTSSMTPSIKESEETQREVLKEPKEEEIETTVMFTIKSNEVCPVYGNKGHERERCGKVIGYPKWHPNYKRMQKKGEGSHGQRGENRQNSGGRWNKVRQLPNTAKWAGNFEKEENVNLTAQQLE
ncbi:Gamma-glutamyl cyclotransferase aclK [Bienertia sinuspersici]